MMYADPGTLAAIFAALYTGHTVADHWLQSHHEAMTKGQPGWTGRLACATHVLALTATKAIALMIVLLVCGITLNLLPVVIALTVDATSHYWIDRRTTLQALARFMAKPIFGRPLVPGKDQFAQLGDPKAAPCGTGAYALDQSFHIGFLFVAALVASLGTAVA